MDRDDEEPTTGDGGTDGRADVPDVTGDGGTPAPTTAVADPAPHRRRLPELSDTWARVIMAVLIVGALVGIVFTVRNAATGNDATSESKPAYVDRLIPASGSDVLRQASVGIDVAAGYDGYLIVNNKVIRTAADGLVKDLGTGLIQFTPAPGRKVEQLEAQQNCVQAMVWKQSEGEKTAKPVVWCFNAT